MPDKDPIEGKYAEWQWNATRKCWEVMVPHRIYPHEDGSFTVSSNDVWHDGAFETFEAAENDAFS